MLRPQGTWIPRRANCSSTIGSSRESSSFRPALPLALSMAEAPGEPPFPITVGLPITLEPDHTRTVLAAHTSTLSLAEMLPKRSGLYLTTLQHTSPLEG